MAVKQAITAADFLPDSLDYRSLSDAADGCQGCDLYKFATQTVFGEGPVRAEIMLVGEQPGDEEDIKGHPFVGPAGRLLSTALEEAGIDRRSVYLTNVVKHFKWKPRGKRRLHEKPRASEIAACEPWLRAELELVKPQILVCLGATAAQKLLGKDFRITKMRGKWIESAIADKVIATYHPSAILRAPDEETRSRQYGELVLDLKTAAQVLTKSASM
ncbi:MAG TPA: UdgX family uracil-DNA binding protein [Pyrinomonadaceae bacterium]|jgi:DNA polymerase|nr:UdgX family uracil-DNA binding protein [Pyrinomonadaceae bacterium]